MEITEVPGFKLMTDKRIIIEQGPSKRTISYLRKRYQTYLPYFIFEIDYIRMRGVFYISRIHVHCRKSRLTSGQDHLYYFPFPNNYPYRGICMGRSFTSTQANLAKTCISIINHFWQSGFNDDAMYCDSAIRPRMLIDEKPPDWWKKHKFRKGRKVFDGKKGEKVLASNITLRGVKIGVE